MSPKSGSNMNESNERIELRGAEIGVLLECLKYSIQRVS
jgi:hypothetical protein